MVSLILDTSTQRGFVALSQEGKVLYVAFLPLGMTPSSLLIAEVEKALDALSIDISELTSVAAGIGPGSFTGIRTSVAFALGIHKGRAIPFLPFSSLEAFTSKESGPFASVIDARLGAYVLLQQRHGPLVTSLSTPTFIPSSRLDQVLISQRLVGPCFERLPYPHATPCNPDVEHIAALITTRTHSLPKLLYLRDLDFFVQNRYPVTS